MELILHKICGFLGWYHKAEEILNAVRTRISFTHLPLKGDGNEVRWDRKLDGTSAITWFSYWPQQG